MPTEETSPADVSPKVRQSIKTRLGLRLFLGFIFCTYIVFCPAVNEPLYSLLAVLPNREYIDLNQPVKMGAFKGEHCFFPVLKQAGEGEVLDKAILLHGVFFKTNASKRHGIAILNPGNSFCLTHMLGCKPFYKLLNLGYDLFIFDYEGFGESGGRARYNHMGNDALSAYDYIHAHKPGEPIILYGMSMGTGVSSYVAARRSVAAMILDSPFISPERTAKDWFSILNLYPTQMFPEPRYDNGDFLAGKHPPALIIVKGCDAICWPTQGTELASRAIPPTTTMILPNSQHLYVDTRDEAAYDKGTSQFLDGVEKLNVLVTR